MLKNGKNMVVIRYVILPLIFVIIYGNFYMNIPVMIGLRLLGFFLIVNDIIRKTLIKAPAYKAISLIFNIIGAGIILYFADGAWTKMYLFILLGEIFRAREKYSTHILIVHALTFFGVMYLKVHNLETGELLKNLSYAMIPYFGVAVAIYSALAVKAEQEEIKKLNEQLREANIMLREYSVEAEGLASARERTRVAQELHDSLGHSLMALNMHLEFAKKTFDTKPEKSKEMLIKAESISKDSINSLREAVKTLKEKQEIGSLKDALTEMLEKFKLLGDISIELSVAEEAEEASQNIKNCIYKTVQEGITNSLKHGRADTIVIKISSKHEGFTLTISDNGSGCKEIVASNGITGIRDRIAELNGTVDFKIGKNNGFEIETYIPL